LYLLDDPFSAQNDAVATHIFHQLGDFLKGKAVLLISNQVQLLQDSQSIILVSNGMVTSSSVKDS
jgi:ABC-type transport system involved in cytochrome bd biosynthesis fused ATPase/permease subunit